MYMYDEKDVNVLWRFWSVVAAVWSDNFPSKTADERSEKEEEEEKKCGAATGWVKTDGHRGM